MRKTLIALVAVALSGCGSALLECKLEAARKLPEDPLAINGHDVTNFVARLQTCEASGGDAGAP